MTAKILFVDDETNILDAYRRQLGRKYEVECAVGGEEGLAALTSLGPFAVVVSDMNMAGMNGVRFLAKVREMAPDSTRIMLTGADRQTAIQAVNEGNIFRFLTKPCSTEMLDVTIEAAVTHHKLVVSERTLLSNTLTGAVKILTDVLAIVRPVAFGRTDRVRGLVRWMAGELVPQQLWRAELATMLSQVGCMGIPDDVLARAYAGKKLDPRETKMYAEHPRAGHDLVAHVPRLQPVAEIILQQGKWFNGMGFPQDDIAGETIPMESPDSVITTLPKMTDARARANSGGNPSASSFATMAALSFMPISIGLVTGRLDCSSRVCARPSRNIESRNIAFSTVGAFRFPIWSRIPFDVGRRSVKPLAAS